MKVSSCLSSLGLTDALARAVADVGYTEPTPIQKQAIPPCSPAAICSPCANRHRKTAGFVLPILQRLAQHQAPRMPSGTFVP